MSSNKTILFIALCLSLFIACSEPANEYVESGISHVKLGEYQKAIEDYTKAIELNPEDAIKSRLYSARGWSYDELGEDLKAIKDYIRAGELE